MQRLHICIQAFVNINDIDYSILHRSIFISILLSNTYTMTRYINFIALLFSCYVGIGQSIIASDLIEKSINYHDPDSELFTNDVNMVLIGSTPDREDRITNISFNIEKEEFQMSNQIDGKSIVSDVKRDVTTILLDGTSDYSKEEAGKYRLSVDRVTMMKNYYQYLWLMPMKLNDPGTIIDPEVKLENFFGKESLAIKVTYSEEVGKDTWYFYFSPSSYAMLGYRFYHDESKNDGEYIILEDEAIYKNVRLPKKRTWYTHAEDKILGTDILDSLKF